MIRRLRWLMGRNQRSWSSKTLTNSSNHHSFSTAVSPLSGTLHEVAIYIHRFHNLDLFQQGWYQIKISMRLEDNELDSIGTPARVVQYEAATHIQGFEGAYGVWRIDDVENSFSTQPFMIKYAKQDVYLSIMVSFVLSLHTNEGPPTSAVILKFELLFSPTLENGSELLASLNACPAAVHEFRIPPKALLGLHSYCPVHFDTSHAVLVDTSIHITMLKASSMPTIKDTGQVGSVDSKQVMVIKELLAARDILLHDLQKIGKAIDQSIDLNNFVYNLDDAKFGFIVRSNFGGEEEVPQNSDRSQNDVKKTNGTTVLQNDALLYSLSWDELVNSMHLLGDQILHLWNTFLMFHRANKLKILEFLHDAWADDRRAEWSIWMVYSKVEKPLNYVNSRVDGSSSGSLHGKTLSLWKFSDDPIQSATMRAELHRQSIAQMRINNRSLQDMHIFGDPLRIPIIIVEHVLDAPLHAQNGNSFISSLDPKDMLTISCAAKFESEKIAMGSSLKRNGRVLKIVVFVHGFQGHHLDLRLVRNQWLLIDPKIEFLMSEANEEKTDGDFREMGLRLAEEVVAFTKKKMDKASRTGNLRNIKLSFVGHSIGNIIIRAALAESIMEPYMRYLHTYVSLSGPHLGYMYSSNSLFNSGLWLLKKLKGTQCIHQLTFSDDPDLTNTFLYKLCKKTLENFKNVVLVSSPQDGYVPYHSARIEMCSASLLDYTKRGKIFWEMLNACLSQMQTPSTEHRVFMRCDVNFDISSQGRNLNTLIGRAAHVEFLESDIFARFIMRSFPELFR
ncbi:uncharacterized protein [Euphorbia lathyris]|uniref:uncharacterized protein isoform X2 n=1 Tax=Euphorbia lathyris TaxID=212925 RepID=UPI0033132B9F